MTLANPPQTEALPPPHRQAQALSEDLRQVNALRCLLPSPHLTGAVFPKNQKEAFRCRFTSAGTLTPGPYIGAWAKGEGGTPEEGPKGCYDPLAQVTVLENV